MRNHQATGECAPLFTRVAHREIEAKLLQSLKKLLGLKVLAGDTPAGRIDDFLVEEQSWKIEFAVLENPGALADQIRTVRYEYLGTVSPDGRSMMTTLSPQELEQLSVQGQIPSVADQMEREAAEQFGSSDSRQGGGPKSAIYGVLDDREFDRARSAAGGGSGEPHAEGDARAELQRIGELTKYHVETEDGALFPVRDFLADQATGYLRYLVVETPDWNPESDVLLPPAWIREVSWPRWRIYAKGRAEDFKKLSRFDPRSHDDLNRN